MLFHLHFPGEIIQHSSIWEQVSVHDVTLSIPHCVLLASGLSFSRRWGWVVDGGQKAWVGLRSLLFWWGLCCCGVRALGLLVSGLLFKPHASSSGRGHIPSHMNSPTAQYPWGRLWCAEYLMALARVHSPLGLCSAVGWEK